MSIGASWDLTGENLVIVASSLDVLHRSMISCSPNGSCDINKRIMKPERRERRGRGGERDRNKNRIYERKSVGILAIV